MTRCVGRLVLTLAFVVTGGSAPFAHVHPDVHVLGVPAHEHAEIAARSHHHRQGAHWHVAPPAAGGTPASAALTEGSDHHVSVTTIVLAVKQSSDAGSTTRALPAAREPSLVSARPMGQPLRAPDETRPNPPPGVVSSDRAPPA